jgi:hypothetical protein
VTGIAAFALGLSAARSVKGQTWAGDNVLFEPTNPVEVTAPLICVYAGRGRSEIKDKAIDFAGDVRLRFEVFLPPTFTSSGVTFNNETSQSLVFALIWRQILGALTVQQSAWANVFREVLIRTHALECERDLFEPVKGQKIPVAVYELWGETVADPAVGEAASGVWTDFLAAMAGDTAELSGLAFLFEDQILGSGGALPDWQVAMGLLGMTNDETQAAGLGPAMPTDTLPATDLGDGAPAQETVDVTITPLP